VLIARVVVGSHESGAAGDEVVGEEVLLPAGQEGQAPEQ